MTTAVLAPAAPFLLAFAAFFAKGAPGSAGSRPGAASNPDEDRDLVDRCLAGDRRAFDELYRRHASVVHGRLTRLVGNSPEVEDLVQQVFLESFRSLPKFRGDAAFRTWLYRIVVNVAMGALRKQRRHPSVAVAADAIDGLIGTELSPETQARERELYERALQHVATLKPKHKIAFVLRHVEQLSLEEIASIVGANAPAVGQRVRKAERELISRIAIDERRARRRREEANGRSLS